MIRCQPLAQRRQLGAMMDQLGLSARALHRIQRVARTLADLDASPQITEAHLMEAVALHRPCFSGNSTFSRAKKMGSEEPIF